MFGGDWIKARTSGSEVLTVRWFKCDVGPDPCPFIMQKKMFPAKCLTAMFGTA